MIRKKKNACKWKKGCEHKCFNFREIIKDMSAPNKTGEGGERKKKESILELSR